MKLIFSPRLEGVSLWEKPEAPGVVCGVIALCDITKGQ